MRPLEAHSLYDVSSMWLEAFYRRVLDRMSRGCSRGGQSVPARTYMGCSKELLRELMLSLVLKRANKYVNDEEKGLWGYFTQTIINAE